MRYVVAIEGVRTFDRRILMPGSLSPKDIATPVYVRNGHGIEELVGKGLDFYRDEENGEISFSVALEGSHHPDILKRKSPHIYATDIIAQNVDGTMHVHKAIIRGIFFTPDMTSVRLVE